VVVVTELLRCSSCGGAVVWDAAESGAACLFCGQVSLELHMLSEPLPVPEQQLPMAVSPALAERSFRTWTRRSWFRPAGLAAVELGLRPIMLPAWRFAARLESHWAGLEPAARKNSGRAPKTGVDQGDAIYMVPASAGLTQAELHALQPFDVNAAQPWTPNPEQGSAQTAIWEPPALTQRGARARAQVGLTEVHRGQIAARHRLDRCRVTSIIEERDVRLLLVPIYIGVFRYRDRPWRVLINGQTGVIVGDAPIDRRKVLVIALLLLAIVGIKIWFDARGL
jgi:hypothetical protein